jgi:hypothetical protein
MIALRIRDALGVIDASDPPAGAPVALEQAHLIQEVGQALDLGLWHRRDLSHVTILGNDLSNSRTP